MNALRMPAKAMGLWFVVAIATVAGCDTRPAVVPVSGKVKLDGEPLKFGSVMLQNEAGGQPAVGAIQPDGSFVLSTFAVGDGATPGSHRVRVTCYSLQDPAVWAEAGPMGDSLGKLLIPKKYVSFGASGLSAEIGEAENAPLLFELSSK